MGSHGPASAGLTLAQLALGQVLALLLVLGLNLKLGQYLDRLRSLEKIRSPTGPAQINTACSLLLD